MKGVDLDSAPLRCHIAQSGESFRLAKLQQEVADLKLRLAEVDAVGANCRIAAQHGQNTTSSANSLEDQAGFGNAPRLPSNLIMGLDGELQEITWHVVREGCQECDRTFAFLAGTSFSTLFPFLHTECLSWCSPSRTYPQAPRCGSLLQTAATSI